MEDTMGPSRNIDRMLAVVFLLLAVVVAANYFTTQQHIQRAHDDLMRVTDCNSQLLGALQPRSDARQRVDEVVRGRDAAFIAWLNDYIDTGRIPPPTDQHLLELRTRAIQAFDVRANPALYAPYPTCR